MSLEKILSAILLSSLITLTNCKKDDDHNKQKPITAWNSCPSCTGILYTDGDFDICSYFEPVTNHQAI